MKITPLGLTTLFLVGSPQLHAGKTIVSEKVPAADIVKNPYRHNGAVTVEGARGSGFCARDRRLAFTAGHVVLGESDWVPSFIYHANANAKSLSGVKRSRTRGYFRWIDFSELSPGDGTGTDESFNRDIAVGYAFKNMSDFAPAKLDMKGKSTLLAGSRQVMITGYPAENAYTGEPITGYFLHRTAPAIIPFLPVLGNTVEATLITTGGGNSGGPVWTGSDEAGWKVSGVLVGGLPSETTLHALSPKTQPLLSAVLGAVAKKNPGAVHEDGVEASSLTFRNHKKVTIPDGVHSFTKIPVNVNGFNSSARLTKIRVTARIDTTHRGDLYVVLKAPTGDTMQLHLEEGADAQDLIIDETLDAFADIDPRGEWQLLVQDRLTGDVATFRSVGLEISAEQDTVDPEDPDNSGETGGGDDDDEGRYV